MQHVIPAGAGTRAHAGAGTRLRDIQIPAATSTTTLEALLPTRPSYEQSIAPHYGPTMPVVCRADTCQPFNAAVAPRPYGNVDGAAYTLAGHCSIDASEISITSTALQPGQYHRTAVVSATWVLATPAQHGNVGAFHRVVVDTGAPGSTWNVAVRFKSTNDDVGDGTAALMRPHWVLLCKPGYNGVVVDPSDTLDESRGLVKFGSIESASGRLHFAESEGRESVPPFRPTTPAIFTGIGAGFYPVVVHTDPNGKVDRITVTFF